MVNGLRFYSAAFFFFLNLSLVPKPFTLFLIHTPAVAELPCNAPACHLEQLWVQCLAQGHLGMWSHVRWLKDQENKRQVVIRDGLWRA